MEPIPQKEYREYQGLIARASSVWARAKSADNYSQFEPVLKQVVDFQKRFLACRLKAGHPDMRPYDLLLNDYEEGFTMKALDEFFETLKREIIPLIQKVAEKRTGFPRITTSGPIRWRFRRILTGCWQSMWVLILNGA